MMLYIIIIIIIMIIIIIIIITLFSDRINRSEKLGSKLLVQKTHVKYRRLLLGQVIISLLKSNAKWQKPTAEHIV